MSFANIYGHLRQVGMLQKELALLRSGHSYIFSGIAAIGKKKLALAFAQALNCAFVPPQADACQTCPSCRKMLHSNHPDIHLLETQEQFIRIDAIRNIQDQMTFKPLEGRKRIFIIDNADKMNEQAANALLKTLEEPSANNIIILVTARPYWLPQTILSRCRHVRFNPLSADVVARCLIEQKQIEPSRAGVLASLSGGSIGQALDQNSEEMIAFRRELSRLIAAADCGNPLGLPALASFLGQDKKEIAQALNILNCFFRDALVYKETGLTSLLQNADYLSIISLLAARLTGEQILQNIALIERSQQTIEMNVNKSLTLEAMAFKLHL